MSFEPLERIIGKSKRNYEMVKQMSGNAGLRRAVNS